MVNLNDSLAKRLEKILGTPIIVSNNITGALLVPYDNENIDIVRLRLIQIEIDKFSKKTKEEKDEFLRNVNEICLFNQSKFLDYGNPLIEPKDNQEYNMMLNFLSKKI